MQYFVPAKCWTRYEDERSRVAKFGTVVVVVVVVEKVAVGVYASIVVFADIALSTDNRQLVAVSAYYYLDF